MVKLIIFDFDGVIITGSNEGYFNCYHKALESVEVNLDPKEEKGRILERWGKGHISQLKLLLKEHPELIDKTIRVYEKLYNSPLFSSRIKLIRGAKNTLKQLSQEYILAIASGMRGKTMEVLIKKFNINYFQKIISINDIKNEKDKKPSPYMINKIRDFFSISKKETIYVGDSKNDVIMARRAKVKPVIVLTGLLSKRQAKNLKVDYTISSIADLPELLVNL